MTDHGGSLCRGADVTGDLHVQQRLLLKTNHIKVSPVTSDLNKEQFEAVRGTAGQSASNDM